MSSRPSCRNNSALVLIMVVEQHAVELSRLLRLLDNRPCVETNPGPHTTQLKQVWISDICHKQIHGRKQISIRCNMIEHWVHQRLPPARGGTAQRKIFHLANRSQLIHPGPSSSRSRFFMESSQLYAATLTHYSTEPLTTGPDYDPLLLLLALAGDVHPNPGPSRYPLLGLLQKRH